jgi:ubiquitin-like 1-activating enzyme E1 B
MTTSTTASRTTAASSSSSSSRFSGPIHLLSPATFERIQAAHVLVVGAGGIGCELLKSLVLTGFQYIDIIDLDTIDVSNLNRQFLFRRHDVGKSKALVASNAVLQYNKSLNSTSHIRAHHGNIKDQELFNSEYIEKFDLVLNALDNIDARRHVNRLCVNKNIILIESGTQSYMGNVEAIIPHQSECYECTYKATPKQYAVCTIRHTPDKPVHWYVEKYICV